MKTTDYRLGFLGLGHMGQILCKSILSARLVPRSQIHFIQRDPAKMKRNEQLLGITSTSMENLIQGSDLIFLCVRPAQVEAAVQEIKRVDGSQKKIVSILAGVPIQFFKNRLGEKTQLVRMMPNVASSIGQGMTIFSAEGAEREFLEAAIQLAAPLGPSLEVPERLFDAATGIAGSGPGFVFKLIQAMAFLAEKEGFSLQDGLKMAAQVFIGAGQLIASGEDPSELIGQIATPGGTTEAGFQKMKEAGLLQTLQETVSASIQKARQMAKEFI